MKLYNTYSRQLETLHPLDEKTVRVYSCGLTVYNFAHIGNLRAYIFTDILIRSLQYLGYPTLHGMNVTDVGHLTSDADEGEDKMEVAMKRENKDPLAIARHYEKKFFEDLETLRILHPQKVARATETIPEQLEIIQTLTDQGYTYQTSKAIYFDVSKFPEYGKLSGQKLEEKKSLTREELVEDPEKRHQQDFALWMFTVGKHAQHILKWSSPWGEGFPGWHIECSAISKNLLGQPFDIHTGGVDHIGVHHENEIAQSVAAFHTPLAAIWMHNEHLLVDGKKMSKSLGNVYALEDIEKKNIPALGFRYFCLQAHYRSTLNFTWDALLASVSALQNLYNLMKTVYVGDELERKETADVYITEFKQCLEDDLNTPKALAVVWNLVKDSSVSLTEKKRALLNFDEVLALGLHQYAETAIPPSIEALILEREEARRNKQFIQSDTLRNKLHELGYGVDDAPQGTYIYKKD